VGTQNQWKAEVTAGMVNQGEPRSSRQEVSTRGGEEGGAGGMGVVWAVCGVGGQQASGSV